MATAIESGIGTLNYGRQSAKGTPATAGSTGVGYNRPKWAGGMLKPNKKLGSEEYVDGNRFASPSQFTETVGGEVGSVTLQLQPENAGLWFAQVLGSDIVTGGSDPYTHTITAAAAGMWGTWWQKTGSAVGPQRDLYTDAKVSKFSFQCGTDQRVMHGELDIVALIAAQVYSSDAAKTEDSSDPFTWTEISGAATFDGTVITDVEGETIVIDTQMEPFWGDSVLPGQLIEKKGNIVSTIKSIITDVTLGKYNKAIYGTAAPTAGTNPVASVFYAALSTVYTRSASRTLTITRPKVAVKPDDFAVGPQAEGGKIPIEFGGECLKSGGSAALQVVALTGDATTYC